VEELRQATEKLAEEKVYLEQEIDTELGFEEIVGKSPAVQKVMEQVGKVATSDATVLLLGETGTGKELVARALHRLSRRAGNSFIKMNCAAIPSGLLESELFGYEKGAFTGAVGKKIGRLELADKGTLFLDEIGEIPLALQPKLLRVLQDQEFERLGSTRTIRVNVRLIAATNQDLGSSIAAHEFRSDLFYRINVFPVRVPPLRERRTDIPMLVRYFVQKFARRMERHIETIPGETMNALVNWHWPGNVRELENFIERSVILSEGTALHAPLAELSGASKGAPSDYTLEDAEREHILRVLRETGGVIAGPDGAARRLGLKRTTLQSKMQKLEIRREEYIDT
jgi:formate hydrogenlyase transcriptional activator